MIAAGARFGWLTLTAPATPGVRGARRWHATCGCGRERIVAESDLPRAKSCGCRGALHRVRRRVAATTYLRHVRDSTRDLHAEFFGTDALT